MQLVCQFFYLLLVVFSLFKILGALFSRIVFVLSFLVLTCSSQQIFLINDVKYIGNDTNVLCLYVYYLAAAAANVSLLGGESCLVFVCNSCLLALL